MSPQNPPSIPPGRPRATRGSPTHLVAFTPEEDHLPELFPSIVRRSTELAGKPRDFEILRRRYRLGGSKRYTLEDIGTYFGFKRERVRQLESTAVRRLANTSGGRTLVSIGFRRESARRQWR